MEICNKTFKKLNADRAKNNFLKLSGKGVAVYLKITHSSHVVDHNSYEFEVRTRALPDVHTATRTSVRKRKCNMENNTNTIFLEQDYEGGGLAHNRGAGTTMSA